MLFRSSTLADHRIAAECNPGHGTDCACGEADVELRSLPTFGDVTSNALRAHTWANAIGYKKLLFPLPDGSTLGCARAAYRYSGRFRLPVLPRADARQQQNPQAAHVMVQFWDGQSGATLEATIYFDLNPWATCGVGSRQAVVKIYRQPLTLVDTGIRVACDTEWHEFALELDLRTGRYRSVKVDGQECERCDEPLATVAQPTWSREPFLSVTAESLAAWPQSRCENVFWWTTDFADLAFERLE